MTLRVVPDAWIERYLGLLGAGWEGVTVEALGRLVGAHGRTSVFENVTAILRRGGVGLGAGVVPGVDYEGMLRAREEGRGGGVCFEHAPMFRRLLMGLGYRVTPILAQISFPGSHHATVVDFGDPDGNGNGSGSGTSGGSSDGARYLVDVGSGAPLWRPIRLGETVEIWHTGLGYRFLPDGEEGYVQERWSEEGWQAACRYDLRPASAEAIEAAYQRHQVAGETWVVGNITMVRCTEEAVHRLRDDELVTHTAAGKWTQRLVTRAEYRAAAADVFGLPGLPIGEALDVLEEMRRVRSG